MLSNQELLRSVHQNLTSSLFPLPAPNMKIICLSDFLGSGAFQFKHWKRFLLCVCYATALNLRQKFKLKLANVQEW